VLHWSGEYEQAKEEYENALAVWQRLPSRWPRDLANTKKDLAVLYLDLGELERSRRLLQEVTAVLETQLGPEHVEVGQTLNLVAWAHYQLDDFQQAERLYERALSICETALGPTDASVAAIRENFGLLCRELGRRERAETLLRSALAIRRQVLGAEHPLVAQCLTDLALLLLDSGDLAAAVRHALDAEKLSRSHLRIQAQGSAEQGALRHALRRSTSSARASGLSVALTALAECPSCDFKERVWRAVASSRALVLDTIATRNKALADTRRKDPKVAELLHQLSTARGKHANLLVRTPGVDNAAQHRNLLRESEEEARALERRLAAANGGEEHPSVTTTSVAGIRAALPENGALVSFVRYEAAATVGHRKNQSTRSYLAFVQHAAHEGARVYPLGDATRIDTAVRTLRRRLPHQRHMPRSQQNWVAAENSYRDAARILSRLIWEPLHAEVEDAQTVFLVPDGDLHLVPFATLPNADGKYLIESGPTLHHLAAERDVSTAALSSRGRGLLALGGADFDASPTPAPAAAPEVSTTTPFKLRGLRFAPLPKTLTEARAIEDFWSQEKTHQKVLLLEGSAANEARFQQEAAGRQIIHIATHAFSFDGTTSTAFTGTRGFGALVSDESQRHLPERDVTSLTGSPLRLAGLALSGANHRHLASNGAQDGVLTAEEVAGLDLGTVEWAVLSACATGVGDVFPGEGLLGLRRVFQIAGARTLITSLWPVDDDARRWMTALYRARLVEKKSTQDSVRTATLTVLRDLRSEGKATHPFFWGPWIATGDWR
jgi:CHAT domain-containing protein/tetratricopeptide (TPR) repeat protein